MKKQTNKLRKKAKKPKITPKEILYALIETPINALIAFEKCKPYRVPAKEFYSDERFSCEELAQKIYQMRKRKTIRKFVMNNILYLELTEKGRKILAWEEIKNSKRKNLYGTVDLGWQCLISQRTKNQLGR